MKRLAALLAASLLLAGCTAAGSGGMRASRPTAARKAAAVPVWPQTQNLFVGAGFIPPAGVCAAVPGTMQASSPTEVCYNAGPRFLGWPRHSPSSVGADSISARGCLRRRRVRRDGGIPPYGRPVGCGCPVSRVMFGRFVGEGHAPPAGPCRTANIHGRAMALPYEPAQMPPPSGWCETQNLFVGAGFIPPGAFAPPQGPRDDLRPKSRACGPVGLRNAPAGAVQASSPTGVCCNAGPQLPGWPPHRRRP